MKLYSITTATPVGDFSMIAERQRDTNGVLHDMVLASGFGDITALQARLPQELHHADIEAVHTDHPYIPAISEYFSGDANALAAIPYRQEGSEFHHTVWRAISAVPYGKTLSYKELALAAGSPSAIRAAGTVCARNRFILLVPCHRIIRTNGEVGEYLYGAEIKEYLLNMERGLG